MQTSRDYIPANDAEFDKWFFNLLTREFVKRYLHFEPRTKEDRVNMGLPEHDTVRTEHFEVDEHVDFVFKPSNQREVDVDFWVKGYDGAVLIHCIRAAGEPAPASHEELTLHVMASRTPHTLRFDETDRGKTVYVALAWQNARGILGAWSDIQSAIIP